MAKQNVILSSGSASTGAGEDVPPRSSPASPPVAYPAEPKVKCTVEIDGDSAYAMVLIEPHILKRLKTRYPQNLDQKLWDNVFRPALETSVY